MPAYLCLWEYDVAPARQAEFARVYGPAGEWARLFRRGAGYFRTELYRDRTRPDRFVTFDYWESEAAFQSFRQRYAAEYRALDQRCQRLTLREAELGRFEAVA